jgi:tetratricopeptide (TPR) repeat protein
MLNGFLFGTGVGTYSVDFSRFKQINFNQNETLWNLTFFRSSSFVLELLVTTGILGFLSFIFLSIKVVELAKNSLENPMLISVLLIFAAAFVLPLSFVTQTLLFILLALFAAYETALNKKQASFFDVDIQIVALRKGLLAIEATAGRKSSLKNRLLPLFLSLIVFVFVLGIGFYSLQYVISDLSFQRSIVAASQNNGLLTYREQIKAINKFPYRDGFYRVHSQTNLALADSLASQIKQGETPNQQTQQNIINLIQQSINSARTATAISPLNFVNWQNLSNIYRSLLGFGQNADQFAIATQQQAIILNPNNPLQYLTLGGIYYQLERWDEAQNQFQIAIRLKPDLPNSHYNLGHVLEKKGDIQAALEQYEIVKRFVANDPSSLKQITDEINVLASKEKEEPVGKEAPTKKQAPLPLEIDQPSSSLPTQEPPVEIPPPTESEE